MNKKRSDAGIKRGPRPKRETLEDHLERPHDERVSLAAEKAMIMASAMYRMNQHLRGMTYAQTDAEHIAITAHEYQVSADEVARAARTWKELEAAQLEQLQAGRPH